LKEDLPDDTESTLGNHSAVPISPAKLSHAVLRTTRLKEIVEWYKTVLNAEVLYQNDFLVFMTYDEEHHRIALVAVPGLVEKPQRCAGLDHLAFFYSTFSEWIETYERLKAADITPRVPIHHGLTMSLYYRDPSQWHRPLARALTQWRAIASGRIYALWLF
jgi:catechol-2,3-dioxygenase